MTESYIVWAQTWCPEPLAPEALSLRKAAGIYDLVDGRLGDDAEGDDFLTRILWLETAIRLARAGWTIAALEDARWPVSHAIKVAHLIGTM